MIEQTIEKIRALPKDGTLEFYIMDGGWPVHKRTGLTNADLHELAERLEKVEVALRNSNEVFERLLEGQKRCGDPGEECPMQDAHKERYEWEPAGALRINREALKEQTR